MSERRAEVIRIIENDDRSSDDLLSWRNGYMSFETVMSRLIERWHNDHINREFIDIAQQIVDEADNETL